MIKLKISGISDPNRSIRITLPASEEEIYQEFEKLTEGLPIGITVPYHITAADCDYHQVAERILPDSSEQKINLLSYMLENVKEDLRDLAVQIAGHKTEPDDLAGFINEIAAVKSGWYEITDDIGVMDRRGGFVDGRYVQNLNTSPDIYHSHSVQNWLDAERHEYEQQHGALEQSQLLEQTLRRKIESAEYMAEHGANEWDKWGGWFEEKNWHARYAGADGSISENVKWGKRNSLKNGKVPFQYGRLLGYEKGENGMPKIVPEQAAVVRRIYAMFLAGYSIARIKSELEAEGVLSASGKAEWSHSVIRYLLSNEKYIGDALLQKTYVKDCISKQVIKNSGEVPQHYVSNNHEAIIPRDIFYKVQEELARRNAKRKVADKNVKTERGKYSSQYALSELLTCGECGTRYRRVTWARNGKKKIVWRCISRLEYGTQYCKHSPTIEEYKLHAAILNAARRLVTEKDELFATLKEDVRYAVDPTYERLDRFAAERKSAELDDSMREMIDELGQTSDNPGFEKFQQIMDEKAMWVGKLAADNQRMSVAEVTSAKLAELNEILDAYELDLTAYDDAFVHRIVDDVKVLDHEKLRVRFYGEIEVELQIE